MKGFKINQQTQNRILNDIRCEKIRKKGFFFFLGKWKQLTIHIYNNQTILLQGNENDKTAFLQKYQLIAEAKTKLSKSNVATKVSTILKKITIPYFGCDESGVGDFFGPVVLSMFYLNRETLSQWKQLQICDSKQLSQKQIETIAPLLMRNKNNFAIKIISNNQFNQEFGINMNLKELITYHYLKMIDEFIDQQEYSGIIIDGFLQKKTLIKYVQKCKINLNPKIHLVPKGENQYLAVAAASIISRFVFLQEIKKIENIIGQKVLLGASDKVKTLIKELQKKQIAVQPFVKMGYKGVKKD